MSTSGDSVSAAPISGPDPQTKLRTQGGSTESTILHSSTTASGSTGAGLTTAVLPQASAGPILPAQLVIGKLNGLMHATTPIGSRTATPPARNVPAGFDTGVGGNPSWRESAAKAAYLSRRA